MKYKSWAQSHVAVSFETLIYSNSDAIGTLRILEAVKNLDYQKKQNISIVPVNFMEK